MPLPDSNNIEQTYGELADFVEKDWEKAKAPKPVHLLSECNQEDRIRVFGSNQLELSKEQNNSKNSKKATEGPKDSKENVNVNSATELKKQEGDTDTVVLVGQIAAAMAQIHLKKSKKEMSVKCRVLPSLGPDIEPLQRPTRYRQNEDGLGSIAMKLSPNSSTLDPFNPTTNFNPNDGVTAFEFAQLQALKEQYTLTKQGGETDTAILIGQIAMAASRCHLKKCPGKEMNIKCRVLPSLGPDTQPEQRPTRYRKKEEGPSPKQTSSNPPSPISAMAQNQNTEK